MILTKGENIIIIASSAYTLFQTLTINYQAKAKINQLQTIR